MQSKVLRSSTRGVAMQNCGLRGEWAEALFCIRFFVTLFNLFKSKERKTLRNKLDYSFGEGLQKNLCKRIIGVVDECLSWCEVVNFAQLSLHKLKRRITHIHAKHCENK